MLEVDKTFTMIWLSRSSEVRVKVRRWPQSPFGTIFSCMCWKQTAMHQWLNVWNNCAHTEPTHVNEDRNCNEKEFKFCITNKNANSEFKSKWCRLLSWTSIFCLIQMCYLPSAKACRQYNLLRHVIAIKKGILTVAAILQNNASFIPGWASEWMSRWTKMFSCRSVKVNWVAFWELKFARVLNSWSQVCNISYALPSAGWHLNTGQGGGARRLGR